MPKTATRPKPKTRKSSPTKIINAKMKTLALSSPKEPKRTKSMVLTPPTPERSARGNDFGEECDYVEQILHYRLRHYGRLPKDFTVKDDLEHSMYGLLCDLAIYCDHRDVSFSEMLRVAADAYDAETEHDKFIGTPGIGNQVFKAQRGKSRWDWTRDVVWQGAG